MSRLPGPAWAWYGAALLVFLVVFYRVVVKASRRTAATEAGDSLEGLNPDVAAALSGQPSVNHAPVDSLSPQVLVSFGVEQSSFDTIGTRLARAAQSVTYQYSEQ